MNQIGCTYSELNEFLSKFTKSEGQFSEVMEGKQIEDYPIRWECSFHYSVDELANEVMKTINELQHRHTDREMLVRIMPEVSVRDRSIKIYTRIQFSEWDHGQESDGEIFIRRTK